MRHSRTESIDKVVESYLKALGIDKKMKEVMLINSWEEIVGKTVARVTESLFIRHGTLYVSLRSSVVRNELQMLKSGLIKALNEKAGTVIINEIVLK